jgi:hypothetical protein
MTQTFRKGKPRLREKHERETKQKQLTQVNASTGSVMRLKKQQQKTFFGEAKKM